MTLLKFQEFLHLKTELVEVEIKKEHIIEYWHNIDDNQNVLIKVEDEEYIVEVDSGEIINTSQPKLYSSNIKELVLSSNFGTTHSSIEQLTPYINCSYPSSLLSLFSSSFSPAQIQWIIEDEDVKEFIGTLYKAKPLVNRVWKRSLFSIISSVPRLITFW
jgi:hypothetical protein